MKLLPIVIAISTISLTACSHSNADSDSNNEAVNKLLKETESHMVFVKGGSFQMGDFGPIQPDGKGLRWSDHQDNKFLHKVTLDDFYISDRQISYHDYDIYTESLNKPKINTEGKVSHFRSPDMPAGINWYQAHDYCAWLAEKTGKSYALPTEAQWEYAARSRGKFLPWATNNGTFKPGENYPTKEERKQLTSYADPHTPYPIAKKYPPNPLGIYQMGLNGYEWVSDWYDKDYYKNSPELNPKGPDNGTIKVKRGGPTGAFHVLLMTITRNRAKPDLSIIPPAEASKDTIEMLSKIKPHSYTDSARCVLN